MGWRMTTLGTLIKSDLADHWHLTAGLFHSQEHDPVSYVPYLQLNAAGGADFSVDILPSLMANSTSGELRLTKVVSQETHRHQLQLALRGRAVDRGFGGDENIDFGNVPLFDPRQFPRPTLALTAQSRDATRQLDFGATYEENWQGVGSAAFGILKSNYRRTTTLPLGATETTKTAPWLLSARIATDSARKLVYYGSFTQGLEDSELAPVDAINRSEPPAAARSWQADGGIRYAPNQQWRVILGAFDIHKPYLNLDATNVYRTIGQVSSRDVDFLQ